MHKVSAIVCVSPDLGIGDEGGNLLYRNPTDMAFFCGFTQGKILFVGHNTRITLPDRLSNRVISEDLRDVAIELGWTARSNQRGVVVIGGGKTYKKYASQVEELFVTYMTTPPERKAHTFFDIGDYKHLTRSELVFKNKDFTIRRFT